VSQTSGANGVASPLAMNPDPEGTLLTPALLLHKCVEEREKTKSPKKWDDLTHCRSGVWYRQLVCDEVFSRKAMSEITQVLSSRQGDGCDSEELLPLVYHDLRRMAAARMANEVEGQTLQPTALVHEAWLRIFGHGERRWQNRGHFFGEAAEAMRRILIERARRKSRLKHGHGWVRVELEGLPLAAATPEDKVLLINEALEKLEAEDPARAKVVVMKFFGGLTNQEVAKLLQVTERTVERQWAFAKAWLFQTIREQV